MRPVRTPGLQKPWLPWQKCGGQSSRAFPEQFDGFVSFRSGRRVANRDGRVAWATWFGRRCLEIRAKELVFGCDPG
jgi:hypothetical protein